MSSKLPTAAGHPLGPKAVFLMKEPRISALFAGWLAMVILTPGCGKYGASQESHASPVKTHGQLRVNGGHLLDELGRPVQLRGMSSFWLNHKGEFANERSLLWLKEDWGISLFRIAVPIEKPRGYLADPAGMIAKVDEIVQACVKLSLYVIIDFHTHNANQHRETAEQFFDMMSRQYGHLPNVIYEPWNEPERVSWNADVKPHMEKIISVIRKNDPDNLILAGTPHWCQRVDEAAASPVTDRNTMYVLHFYAGSHRQELRDLADAAMGRGLPIFVSEFGLSHADGGRNEDRNVYEEEANRWMQWMDLRQISWANWSLSDKDESSAALKPGSSPDGGWTEAELSKSGRHVRSQLRNRMGQRSMKPTLSK